MSKKKILWLTLISYLLGILAAIPALIILSISAWGCDPSYRLSCESEVIIYYVLTLAIYGGVTVISNYLFLRNSSAKRSYRIIYELIYIIGIAYLGMMLGQWILLFIFLSVFISYYINIRAMDNRLKKAETRQ